MKEDIGASFGSGSHASHGANELSPPDGFDPSRELRILLGEAIEAYAAEVGEGGPNGFVARGRAALARTPDDSAVRALLTAIEDKALDWAEHYPPHSDGFNTFILFAEWVSTLGRACTCHPSERPRPCQRKYAFSECVAAASGIEARQGGDAEGGSVHESPTGAAGDAQSSSGVPPHV